MRPVLAAADQVAPSLLGEAIDAAPRSAAALRVVFPLPADQAGFFQAVEDGVQRPLLEAQLPRSRVLRAVGAPRSRGPLPRSRVESTMASRWPRSVSRSILCMTDYSDRLSTKSSGERS